MADLANLGFEEDDAGTPGVGIPEAWTITVTAAAEEVAAWGAEEPPLDEDSFEIEWANDDYLFAFGIGDTAPTLFDEDVGEGEGFEDFEEGWDGNESYAFEDNSNEAASFDASLTPQDREDFSDGWDSGVSAGNDYDTALGASTAASFDAALTPQAFEDFSDGWSGTGAGNDYDTTMGSTTAASFDGVGADSVEDFEEVFQEVGVTVAPGTDLFTAGAAHGLSATDKVTFRLRGAGVLPAGVNAGYTYFVIASGLTGTAFRVSLTSGGSTIDVTDAGAGEHLLRGDPSRFWILDA